MSLDEVACCKNCAYKQNTERGIICKFHYMEVKENLVCDDFLDEFDSPLYRSLAQDSAKVVPQHTWGDWMAYLVTGFLLASFALGIMAGIFVP